MKLPNIKSGSSGKGKSSKEVPSAEAAVSTLQELGPSRPSPRHFEEPTIDTPDISHAYRDNWLLRKYVLTYTRQFHPRGFVYRCTLLVRLPFRAVIKYGAAVQLSEASTLRFVAKSTSVPVPRVYCAFSHEDINYILMEYVKGEPLGDVWPITTPTEKKFLLKQLEGYFDQVRKIPHPRPGAVCGALIGPLFDRRIGHDKRGFGPFANERDFNNYLRCGAGQEDVVGSLVESYFEGREDLKLAIQDLIDIQDNTNHQICFTHGDAHSGNFLVRNGKIVAVLDFEMSGFFPEHWEYTTAMTTGGSVEEHDEGSWKLEVRNFLKEYPSELEGEIIRQDIFGMWGIRNAFDNHFPRPGSV